MIDHAFSRRFSLHSHVLAVGSVRELGVCVAKRGRKNPVQLELTLPAWGGKRKGAGRKRVSGLPSVPHVARAPVKEWNPLLVTVRMRDGLPSLREQLAWDTIVRTMQGFRGTQGLAFVEYSVMSNHQHLMAESQGREALSRGMQAFSIRLAKALNELFGRTGPVFAGRYHVRELSTPTEVRNAVRYVLLNARHHAAAANVVLPPDWIDPRSTAAGFDGWRDPPRVPETTCDFGTSPARTWLLREGWRRYGLLEVDDVPGRPSLDSDVTPLRRRAA